MTERAVPDLEIARPAGRVRMFLDALGSRFFPPEPILPKGRSENPAQDMVDLLERMRGTRNTGYLVLYARRLQCLSKQL